MVNTSHGLTNEAVTHRSPGDDGGNPAAEFDT